ncbi:MAG TPA: alpha/beta hydrolase [Ktedonobacterales bacterium]|jgi:pimeloyl-ACP methyl ester carboxylesterase
MQRSTPGEIYALPDGRALGFAQFGSPDGKPLLFFHGLGASRLTRHPDDSIAAGLGVRLITIDRPGIGLSDPKPGRTLLDWPDDVVALADALGIGQFAVLGWSGGGAHALACAYKIPERLSAIGVVSGGAPLAGIHPADYLTPQWWGAARIVQVAPWAARLFAWQQGRQARHNLYQTLEAIIARYSKTDRALLDNQRMRAMMLETTLELFRQGSRGLYDDMLVLARPWRFRLEGILKEVFLWHGEADTLLAPAFGRHLAQTIPNCRATFYHGEGHCLLLAHWRDLLMALTMPETTHTKK